MVLVLCMGIAAGLQAQVVDLSSSVTVPDEIMPGVPFTATVGYTNHGPDTVTYGYPNGKFVPPMGLDVFLDNYWNGDGSMYSDLLDSAVDSLGNVPLLFWDDFYCEVVHFQVQGDASPEATPIAPLGAGESGSFSFETTFPRVSPRGGTVEVSTPPSLAKTWTLTDPAYLWVRLGYGGVFGVYSTTSCDQLVGGPDDDVCMYITDNCWGGKISHLPEPIQADFVLVDDGTADPTLGCEPPVNDVNGKIAVLERGVCEFGVKGFNAEQAGAVAVFMINDGRCGDYPDSPDCVNNMGSGALGGLVTIPVAQISQGDGAPILAALQSGQAITGLFGGASKFALQGWFFIDAGSTETDPNDENDVSVGKADVLVVVFEDGFESGDPSAWDGFAG